LATLNKRTNRGENLNSAALDIFIHIHQFRDLLCWSCKQANKRIGQYRKNKKGQFRAEKTKTLEKGGMKKSDYPNMGNLVLPKIWIKNSSAAQQRANGEEHGTLQ